MQLIKSKYSEYLIWIFPILAYQFFQFNKIDKNISIVFSVFFILFIILFCYKQILSNYRNQLITKYKHLFIWILLASLICPLIFWGQNILLSFRISIEIYRYVFFFLLIKASISEKKLVKIIDFYVIFILVLKISYISFNLYGYFGYNEGISPDESRGLLRPKIEGIEFAILSLFLHINNFFKNKKILDIFFILLAVISIFLELTRQIIFFTTITSLLFILKNSKYKFILITVIGVSIYFIPNILIKSKLPIINDMIELSQTQIESNKNGNKDIRLIETQYFLFYFNETIPQIIIGNGQPHGYSEYGKKIIRLSENEELYTNDIGYIQLFIGFGLVGLALFFSLYYSIFKYKVNENYIWIKYYLLNLTLLNIASQAIFLSGISFSIIIYLMIMNKSANKTIKRKLVNDI